MFYVVINLLLHYHIFAQLLCDLKRNSDCKFRTESLIRLFRETAAQKCAAVSLKIHLPPSGKAYGCRSFDYSKKENANFIDIFSNSAHPEPKNSLFPPFWVLWKRGSARGRKLACKQVSSPSRSPSFKELKKGETKNFSVQGVRCLKKYLWNLRFLSCCNQNCGNRKPSPMGEGGFSEKLPHTFVRQFLWKDGWGSPFGICSRCSFSDRRAVGRICDNAITDL